MKAKSKAKPALNILIQRAGSSCYRRWYENHAKHEWNVLQAVPCLYISPLVAAYLVNDDLTNVEIVVDSGLIGLSMYCHEKSFELIL